jgi:hypothetical protein
MRNTIIGKYKIGHEFSYCHYQKDNYFIISTVTFNGKLKNFYRYIHDFCQDDKNLIVEFLDGEFTDEEFCHTNLFGQIDHIIEWCEEVDSNQLDDFRELVIYNFKDAIYYEPEHFDTIVKEYFDNHIKKDDTEAVMINHNEIENFRAFLKKKIR